MKYKKMNKATKDILVGGIVALTTGAIIIISIEQNKSFFQIIFGFAIFLVPFTFLSIFNSKIGSFIFVFCTTLLTYLVSKFAFQDFWIGVALATIIGGSMYYFRVSKYKPFSPSEYKKLAKEKFDKINNNGC